MPGARSVVSAALCYWQPETPLEPGHGRLARYTWDDAYAELREKLDALGRAARRDVPRARRCEPARRPRGCRTERGGLLRQEHAADHAAATARGSCSGRSSPTSSLEPTPPLDTDCGECRLCIDACPTGALDEAGTLDATRCLSYWTQAPHAVPEPYRRELGAQVYGCDICQDVCPWNRGVEKRRDDRPPTGAGHVDLRAWLESDGRALVAEYDRLFVPRNDPRWLRRNALVALGNTGDASHEPLLERFAADDDELLAEHAAWALAEVRAAKLALRARRPQLGAELACPLRDPCPQLERLEHDRLAAVRDDLADHPVGAADRLLGERGAVDERAGRPSRPPTAPPPASTRCAPCWRRGARRDRSPRAAGTSCAAPSRAASGRGGTSAPGRARCPRCGRTRTAGGARSSTARRCASRPPAPPASGTRSRRGGARRSPA